METTLEEYIALIRQWAVERNIIAYRPEDLSNGIPEGYYFPMGGGTELGQARKLLEEASEVLEAATLLNAQADWTASEELMRDALGDTFVVLVILASGANYDFAHQCVRKAWHEIKDRKGRMINGKFVKDEDLPNMPTSEGIACEQQAPTVTTSRD